MSIDLLTGAMSAFGAPTPDLRGAGCEDAARAFEAYLAEQMVREMRRSLPEGALGGQAVDMFAGLLDQQIALRIGERGGFGLADALVRTWGDAPGPEQANAEPAGEEPGSPARRRGRLPVASGRVVSGFGEREDPFTGASREHKGIDIAAPVGTPIHALAGGRVVRAAAGGSYGNLVVVRQDDGRTAYYAHCDTLDVAVGARVEAGQVLATVGQSGRATGPHLHLEVRENGRPIDPLRLFRGDTP